ncbi:VOC family protein [Streptomyces sp. G-G2]|uniref:VOC family protein n=1 Tax=Streptomyces sp. G-G2 TaxID=3046201 RepID=UPI0024BB347B|nr:VOC family protein [Streptomyces sp. G-G2]MDJ0379938.1 VOC family protein [Streptomyces sp. G-G2]
MSVELNHTIIFARDSRESAEFLAHILGLDVGAEWGPFIPVATANGVTLDFATLPTGTVAAQHYAFLISEAEFDASFERIRAAGITYYADPFRKRPGEINRNDGGRGLYFLDPSGHGMEIITRPYGSGEDPEDGQDGESGQDPESGQGR